MAQTGDQDTTIAIVEETPFIDKRQVQTDHLRVNTIVDETQAEIVTSLLRDELVIERRATNRQVTQQPPPRQEGDDMIISVVEERPVIEKRLFVVEEVVLRRVTHQQEQKIPVSLRKMRAVIEDVDDGDTAI